MKTILRLFLFITFSVTFSHAHSSLPLVNYQETIFSLIFANDIFNKTDQYYTNGALFNFKSPQLSKGLLKHIFISTGSQSSYSVSFVNRLYTPEDITATDIDYNDRPYCSYTAASYDKQELLQLHNLFINSQFQLGVIGSASMGSKIQINLHKLLDDVIPMGWDHQIKNDIVINYNLTIDKNLYKNSHFACNSYGTTRVGSLHSDLTLGTRVDLGWLNYGASGNNSWFNWNYNSWKLSIFTDISGKLVLYDATLQGGIFNKTSPHTLSYSEITPIIFMIQPGLMLQYKKFGMELRDIYSTKNFDNGTSHMWGFINLFFHI